MLGTLALLLASTTPPAAGETVTIPLNGHNFTLPAGFTIEVAAKSPLIERPVTIAFDEVGRLYVADSSGSNEKLTIQLEKKPHRIVRLDPAKDGVFTTGHVFADKMMFPEGTMWYRGSLYVAAPPSIWKLTDTKNSGVADQRSEWYQGKTLGHCGNDLHGPWLGPDGWFYWTRGGFAPQKHVFFGKEIETRASTLFRAKPDGSQREPIIAGGMDNPVGLAFTPGGEPILTNTFLVYPSNGQRDGLIHAVYGGVYGKDFTDVLAPHIRTSTKLMPVLEHLGPAAPTGIVRYDSDVFGREYQDNMFVGQFNLRKVSRHILTPKGATFESKSSDFVVSDNPDFHPTDVVMDADGSLLIVDTGGWYKLCCPTSQLVKPDALGAIYRVRKVGAKGPNDPRGLKIDWKGSTAADIADLLGDRRPAVRSRAKDTLAARGEKAIDAVAAVREGGVTAQIQRDAVWTLVRIDGDRARQHVRAALKADEESIRQAALHGICRLNDVAAKPAAIALLRDGWPENARAVAETVGRLSESEPQERVAFPRPFVAPAMKSEAARALGDLLKQSHVDPVLNHSLTLALIQSRETDDVIALLNHESANVRRAAFMAIPHMEVYIGQRPACYYLDDPDSELRAAAWYVVARQEWGPALIARYIDQQPAEELSFKNRGDLVRDLAAMSRSPEMRDCLAACVTDKHESWARVAIEAMVRADPKQVPERWTAAVVSALGNPLLEGDAIAAARTLRLPESESVIAALDRLAKDPRRSPLVRLGALAATPVKQRALPQESFAFVRRHLDADELFAHRSAALDVLARSRLTADQLLAVADALPQVSPLEVDRLLELFAGQKDDAVGARLMDALEQPKLAASLRVDSLERRLKNFGPAVQERGAKLYARLNADLAGQRVHLEELLTKLPAGDVRRGQAVFNQAKSACTVCHTIGYVGGKVGPDLTRVGAIRTRRDLLEAIVYPSASFVRGYEPIVIVTGDGKTHNGLIRSENADEITLTTGPNQEERIARNTIESMQPSRVSVMPAGLEQQMSATDLADLAAFLGACK
jgi:putative membrane-bound dehydrogenase-like protein